MDVSNPDRVIFPEAGYTKADVVDHYRRVAPVMLPHLAGRPLTLERYPKGIGAPGFFQKNASRHFPVSIGRVPVPKEDGEVVHPVVDSPDDMVYLANQGTVTFHIWNARLPNLDRPDRLVIDLDPEPGHVSDARIAAREVRDLLTDVGLDAGLMTTGSNGYHLVTPVQPGVRVQVVERTSRLLAGLAASRRPDLLTIEFLKREREGRVFVDWLRNRWAQMTVSPWSLRPKPAAPVAVPISWDELDHTDPDGWTIDTVQHRLGRTDPWPPPADLGAVLGRLHTMAEEAGVSADEPFDRFGRGR